MIDPNLILLLQEPEDTGSQGLYYVLRKAIDNMKAVI